MGRSSSRRSRSVVAAPAWAAPSSATCSAARLLEICASEPPSPTIVRVFAILPRRSTLLPGAFGERRVRSPGAMGQPADLVAAARAHGVREPRLLETIAAVPRARFVAPNLRARAYED